MDVIDYMLKIFFIIYIFTLKTRLEQHIFTSIIS